MYLSTLRKYYSVINEEKYDKIKLSHFLKHGAEAQIQPANLFDPPYTMVVIVLYSNILEKNNNFKNFELF